MSFAREGFAWIAIAALVAAGMYAVALVARSWALWLLAFALTIVALGVAYVFRDPVRAMPRGKQTTVAGGSLNFSQEGVQVRQGHRMGRIL